MATAKKAAPAKHLPVKHAPVKHVVKKAAARPVADSDSPALALDSLIDKMNGHLNMRKHVGPKNWPKLRAAMVDAIIDQVNGGAVETDLEGEELLNHVDSNLIHEGKVKEEK